jgi:hypothetical protein
MNPISQTPEDFAFGSEDLRAGCQEGLYEEVTTGEAERIRGTGAMISSSFVVWQDRPEGRKGRVCGKPVEAIQALAQRKRDNVDTARVRFRVGTRGEDGVIRHPSRIPTFSARSANERLVLVQVRRAFIQVHLPSVRVGSEPDVVYSTNDTHGPKSKATVSSSCVLGRLPDMPRQDRECGQYEGLPEGATGDRQAALIIRHDTASDEGRMGPGTRV